MKPFLFFLVSGFFGTAWAALPMTYDNFVRKYSAINGFDPLLIHAQIHQESKHKPNTCSGAGACGLMQIMPLTAPELGLKASERFNPELNIRGGTLYMRRLVSRFKNIPYALYAYNWGPGNLGKYQRGIKKVMPAETRNYVIYIAKYYHQYGGKGNYFTNIRTGNAAAKTQKTENIANSNRTKITQKQKVEKICPKVSLPEIETNNQAIEDVTAIGGTVAGSIQGQGKVVFDPAKVTQLITSIAQAKQSLSVMRGKYDALTKGLAGFDLLKNISTIAGYEMPETMTENKMVKWGNSQDATLYSQIQEMKAADTGIYASAELEKITNQNAIVINKAYTETELAWSQANCAANNLESLANVQAKTQKQAKDLNNALKIETAIIEANTAKIKANMLIMNSSYQAYRISAAQIYAKWKGSQK